MIKKKVKKIQLQQKDKKKYIYIKNKKLQQKDQMSVLCVTVTVVRSKNCLQVTTIIICCKLQQ